MSAARSYFENPSLLARLLAALTAACPLSPTRPSPHASSSYPGLRWQAYAPLADKLLDLVTRYRRLNPIDIFRVDPDPVQASTQKISGESPLALEAHSESSSGHRLLFAILSILDLFSWLLNWSFSRDRFPFLDCLSYWSTLSLSRVCDMKILLFRLGDDPYPLSLANPRGDPDDVYLLIELLEF